MILAVLEDDLHNIEAHVVIVDSHDPYADRKLIPLPLHQALPKTMSTGFMAVSPMSRQALEKLTRDGMLSFPSRRGQSGGRAGE